MDDLARGERIKALRQGRRLTQPAVVDLLEERAGAQVVTLRGYQAWEAGGGIRWDNAKLLAEVLGVDAEHLMTGLSLATEGQDGDASQLDRIERMLEETQQLMWLVARHAGVITDTESPREFVERAVDEFIREREEDATAEAPTPQAIPHAPSRRAGTKR